MGQRIVIDKMPRKEFSKRILPQLVLVVKMVTVALLVVGTFLFPWVYSAADSNGGAAAKPAVTGPVVNASKSANRIREDINRLQGAEQEADQALDRLKVIPRAEVISVLREDLTASSDIPPGTLKAIVALEAIELLPEFKVLSLKTEDWGIFVTITRLLRTNLNKSSEQNKNPRDLKNYKAEFSGIFLNRLDKLLSVPAKAAVLDGLQMMGKPITSQLFKTLTNDQNLEVRIAAVRQFLATRTMLSTQEQLARWTTALEIRPFQARLLAMEEFVRLPENDRQQMKSAFHSAQCANEKESEVKAACLEVGKSLKRGGKS